MEAAICSALITGRQSASPSGGSASMVTLTNERER
jgi:hypothetical protein